MTSESNTDDGSRLIAREAEPSVASVSRRARHWVVAGIVLGVVFGVGLLSAVWVASPGAGDLLARAARRETGTHAKPVSLAQVSVLLREAVVAAEDERFYRHHGIDSIGVLRAAAYDLTHLSLQQGASTITEQLAKQLYLSGNDSSAWGKLQDAAIALRIERVSSKQLILQAYLNTVYFGAQATGIEAASERYFGVHASALSLAQSSLLAGLIRAPSAYDPFAYPDHARDRQVQVLRSMIRNGFATQDEAIRVLAEPLRLADRSVLPVVGAAALAPEPLVSVAIFLPGFVLFALGTAGLIVRWSRSRAVLRRGSWALVLVGLIVVARSLGAA